MNTSTRNSKAAALALAGVLGISSCALEANANAPQPKPKPEWQVSSVERGKASWYGINCNGGTHTASGERLRNHASTAAHKTLPMGTKVRVVNLDNGKSEVVRITDRGPYKKGRIIDVTEGVAQRLGFFKRGIVKVKVEVLKKAEEPDQADS